MLSAMQPDHVGQAAPPGQLHVTRLQVGQNQKDNADSASPKTTATKAAAFAVPPPSSPPSPPP